MEKCFGTHDFQSEWRNDKTLRYSAIPKESWQSMAVGTGKTGASVWVPVGICLQLNHTDSFASDAELPGLMRLHIDAAGSPFSSGREFSQVLDLPRGVIRIAAKCEGGGAVEAVISANKALDVILVEIADRRGGGAREFEAVPEVWREGVRIIKHEGMQAFAETNTETDFDDLNRRNAISGGFEDPLRGLSYGTAFVSVKDGIYTRVYIAAATVKASSDELVALLFERLRKAAAMGMDEYYGLHAAFWDDFWRKSRVDMEADSQYLPLQASWYMNRYYAASAMDGEHPPKFNGSIFLYERDMRSWGSPYWFQNMRLMYWPLFKTGDIGYVRQFMDMYVKAMPYNRARVKAAYGHGGSVIMETAHFWGAGRKDDMPEDGAGGSNNPYIKAHFSGSLELAAMMLEYYRYTKDRLYAYSTILPYIAETVDFFFAHNGLKDGKLYIRSASACETWWEADDPADQIAGLRAVLPAALVLANEIGWRSTYVDTWKARMALLPELPKGKLIFKGREWADTEPFDSLLPALRTDHPVKENMEDPELYAIWPFSLYGAGMDGYETALNTFDQRIHKNPRCGWAQTAIWAARLGLKDEAARIALRHFAYNGNLPGGAMDSPATRYPGRDDVPDCPYFDTLGSQATALNEMLLQDHTGEIRTLPAWPGEAKISFRLHSFKGPVVV